MPRLAAREADGLVLACSSPAIVRDRAAQLAAALARHHGGDVTRFILRLPPAPTSLEQA